MRVHHLLFTLGGAAFLALLIYALGYSRIVELKYTGAADAIAVIASSTESATPAPVLDTVAYNKKLLYIANCPSANVKVTATSSTGIATTSFVATTSLSCIWPAKAVYPLAGALLPFNRIVAYYGNFYSTSMGVLGEYPPAVMLAMLASTAEEWQAADPSTPVIPAIDYIAVTAQGNPGADGMYRARMPDDQIDEAVSLANQVHGLVILDVQVGLSTVQTEVPLLKKYLAMPNVELAIDPEFAMYDGAPPGTVIGSLDAIDVNFAAQYLAELVREHNLPPKILVIHRFTQEMVTHTSLIKPLPEVEIVMDMDGWGSPSKKIGTYTAFIASEPVQFTGFKLFYKNDLKPPSTRMLTDAEILGLTPSPLFIQYQ
ncbi:MAG: hypothetical protein ABSE76_03470 [Minisyncoccia bacterium]|jgi:hypothetical protein